MSTTTTMPSKTTTREPPYRLRRSKIHGTGVFATRPIKKGTRIIEYLGERISHEEADRRYAQKEWGDNHTFLFTVDSKIVIDAGVRGNAARFINHSCDPNCESIVDEGRIWIEAIRPIAAGEELAYDYSIGRSPGDPPEVEQIFACRCGAAGCRGTMLAPLPKKKKVTSRRRKHPAGRSRPTSGRATQSRASSRRRA